MKRIYLLTAGMFWIVSNQTWAQDSASHNITTYLHVGKNVKKNMYSQHPDDFEISRIKFQLNYKKEWYSDTIPALFRDEKGYLVKVSLPENISEHTDMLSCTLFLYEKIR
ncbi:MAG: hypothetical protein WDM78_05140 [Puia sp.]